MSPRPFINKRINALEQLFADAANQIALLRLLECELQHRSVPRAVALRRRVAMAIARHPEGGIPPTPEDELPLPPPPTPPEPEEEPEIEIDVEPGDTPDSSEEVNGHQSFDGFGEEAITYMREMDDGPPEEPALFDIGDLTDGEIEASEPVEVVAAPIRNEPTDIVESWTALEVLSPQTYKQPADLWDGDPRTVARFDGKPLPWQTGEKARPSTQLYYYVPLGAIRVDEATAVLLKKFGDKRSERTLKTGFAPLACITVDRHGRPLPENGIAVSSFGFGYQHTRQGNLGELKAWPAIERRMVEALENYLIRYKDDKILPLTKELIAGAFRSICNTFALEEREVVAPYFALRVYQHFSVGGEPEPLLLNSFFLEDLARVRDLVVRGALPHTLRQYLGMEHPEAQIDLLNEREAVEELVTPLCTPFARWPTRGGHSLVLLQQAAVNAAKAHLTDKTGIVAVNGPPGTGKTTLLRDIVAHIVFTRAEALAKFKKPEDAFSHAGQYTIGQGFRHLYTMDERVRGHEILVASSNNKAVENVSRELPELDQIEEARAPEYFRTIADNMTGEPESCWGLAAAVLGNSSNRFEFQKRFWKDPDYGLHAYLYAAEGKKPIVTEKDPITGQEFERLAKIVELENPPRSQAEALKRWTSAVQKLRKCRASVEKRLEQLDEYQDALSQFSELQEALSSARAETDAAKEPLHTVLQAHTTARDLLARCEQEILANKRRIEAHQNARPGLFARLFGTASYRGWQQIERSLVQEKSSLTEKLRSLGSHAAAAEKMLHAAQARSNALDQRADDLKEHLGRVRTVLMQADAELGQRLAGEEFWEQSHEDLQISTAWLDDETQRLRDEAFTAAFDLHRAFIGAAAKQVRNNLNCLFDVLRGKGLTEERMHVLPSLWTTLFLVTPVVSTTFASVGRMLRPMPPESLGWLLIDEAGQALPQAAAGALMRARRSVIVGDPLQIEPVVTLSPMLVQKLAGAFGVNHLEWTSPDSSAQRLADRAGPYAAVFAREDAYIRVGAPLLVHRRCDEPMFGISNAVSYGRNMVSAVQSKPSSIGEVLGPSSWIHVTSSAASKWSAHEGEAVLRLLESVADEGCEEPDIFIISPFRIVQDQMRQLIMRREGLLRRFSKLSARNWAYERIGTVHTFQGREADAVILLLGAPNENQNGARGWAGYPPNIVNVAVTRAKRRLYVVGNRQLWQSHGAFKMLSARLPV
ncbi:MULTISPECIES: ATP-binding protein [Rhodomicrobium]|uniref:DEAD/DEAH box helicase n=1 Tax=Rhodomicrobium TaxID=1068 RepID=UPI000B4B1EEB|nr:MULTISPECIES: ATP-binding protein [Rhodomicrobium]